MVVHQETDKATAGDDKIIVKKYANRRLYNTETSSYITLEELYEMVREGKDFIVCDAKTGEDLTRQTLVQIIFEQESKKFSLLPIGFLRTIIQFYDGNMRDMVPPYLDAMMQNFSENQDRISEYFNKKSDSPFAQFEEFGKQNMEFFQKTFSMFSPFEALYKTGNTDKK